MENEIHCSSEFNNCGPIERGEDYCLFHNPNKNEKEAKQFYEELIEDADRETVRTPLEGIVERFVFSDGLDWRGYRFPKNEDESGEKIVNLDYMKCEGLAKLSGATFEADISFQGSEFLWMINAWDTDFLGNVDFSSSTIRIAEFLRCEFQGHEVDLSYLTCESFSIQQTNMSVSEVNLTDMTCKDDLSLAEDTIEGSLDIGHLEVNGRFSLSRTSISNVTQLSHSHFGSEVTMENAVFGKWIQFMQSHVRGDANFKGARFQGEAKFKDTTFDESVEFDGANFEKDASFSGVRFSRRSSFENASFGGELDFKEAFFGQGVTIVSEDEKETFKSTYRIKVEPTWGVSFLRELSEFSSNTIKKVGRIEEFHRDENKVNKEREFLPGEEEGLFEWLVEKTKPDDGQIVVLVDVKEKFSSAQSKEEGCKAQRIARENEGRLAQADEMFLHEMRARRAQKGTARRYLEKVVADWSCEYGTNWRKVIGNSGLFIFIFSLLYWARSIRGESLGELLSQGTFGAFCQALHQSTIVFTTLGFNQDFFKYPVLKALASVESIFGALFTALIILVFARKWMR